MGLCGLVLGLLLGLLLQRQLATPKVTPVPETVPGTDAAGTSSTPAARARSNAPERGRSSTAERAVGAAEAPGRAPAGRGAASERSGRNTVTPSENGASAGYASTDPAPGTTSAVAPAATRAATPRTVAPPPVRSVDMGALAGPDSVSPVRNGPRPPSVVTGASGIMAANLLASPAPAYPVAANTARVQGEVVIEAVVDREGNVSEARVVSGPLLLRDAALDAVQRWRFRPYEVDGKPAEIATTARVEFRLNH